MGKTVTIYNVRDVIAHWAEEADAKRRKAHADAQAKKKSAKEKKAAASADKLRTADETKRAEAETRRQEAQKEYDEAVAAVKASGAPLPFNKDFEVDVTNTSELVRLSLYLGLTVHVNDMRRVAKSMLKDVNVIAKHLTDAEQDEIAAGCTEIMSILEQISALAKRPVRKLASIAGGRA